MRSYLAHIGHVIGQEHTDRFLIAHGLRPRLRGKDRNGNRLIISDSKRQKLIKYTQLMKLGDSFVKPSQIGGRSRYRREDVAPLLA